MKLVIISGRSGSGKSTALQALEDLGFYCIDNLPVALLPGLTELIHSEAMADRSGIAISIDARNTIEGLSRFPEYAETLKINQIEHDIIYLDATLPTLLQRFSSTRRRHPLSNSDKGLNDAIQHEKELLEPMADMADLTLDTTRMSIYELRDVIKQRVVGSSDQQVNILFQSFGFKHGVPMDADLVFDVRCLPNPYWETALRPYNGKDTPVIQYLVGQPEVQEMLDDIIRFLTRWIPRYETNNRSYLTVAIGCTGGQHRSVFLAETLASHFNQSMDNVLVAHRELSGLG